MSRAGGTRPPWMTAVWPFVLAIALTLAIVLLRVALDPLLDQRARFMMPLAGVAAAAILLGPGPAIAAMLVSAVLVLLLLVPSPLNLPDLINAGAFLIVAATFIVLAERLRQSSAAATASASQAEASARAAADSAGQVAERTEERDAVLDAFPDAIVVFGPDGRQRRANSTATELLGDLSLEDVLARLGLAEPPLDRRVETRDERSGCWLEVSSHRLEAAGDAAEVLVLRDVTEVRERRQREEALGAMLSHELRTPLTVIAGSVRVIRRHWQALDPSVQADLLAGIDAETDRMRRLVDDLLILARGPRTEGVPPEPLIIRRLVEEVVREERARRADLDITVAVPPNLPIAAGEAGHVEHILRSLIGNAVKHAPGRAIVVSADHDEGADAIEVVVTDRGAGIEPGQEDRIFELFYRAPGAVGTSGSGIGLYVSRALAVAMGGELTAHRGEGGGAKFVLVLPAYKEPAAWPSERSA
jgi:K+-sensing histidine kinase KdpD